MAGKGVATTHKDYDLFAPKWKRCRDAVAGQDAMRAATTAYIPKLKDESGADYTARLARSDYFNATWRTIDGLSGMAFRKSPTIEVPAGIDEYLKNVNMGGKSMRSLSKGCVEEVLSVGRIGIMVDHPPQDNIVPLTVAAAQERGLRPIIQVYLAETITNWKHTQVDNGKVLKMVTLKECVAIAKDEFEDEEEDRWRVLDLDDAGFYRQRLFKREKNVDVQIGGDVYPLMNNAKLTYIPFTIINPDEESDDLDEPPLIDLVDKNIAHFQVNADYRHGLHFTGLPTLFLSGMEADPSGAKFHIGGTAAILASHPDAKGMFIEFTGQGLGAMEKALDRLEKQMALLGARMIADETRQVETLGATQIKRAGENSVLAKIVQAVSTSLEWALTIFAEWAGQAGEIVYQINRDFTPLGMDAQMFNAYLSAVAAGEMTSEEFFDLMQRGDVVKADVTFEEHQAKLEMQGPAAPVKPDQPHKEIAA